DRLARGGRVAEAVTPRRARVLRRRKRQRHLGVRLLAEVVLLLVFLGGLLRGGEAVRAAVSVPVLVLLVGGDQLGEHPGERVHLVAAELRAGGEVGRLLGEDAL